MFNYSTDSAALSAALPELPAAQMDALRDQFELRDETSIWDYLRQYPFLCPLLLEAREQVRRIFGAETSPALEVSVDPNDWSRQLFIVVPTRLDAKAALAFFDKLDKEWWLEASERADFRMNFKPEFTRCRSTGQPIAP